MTESLVLGQHDPGSGRVVLSTKQTRPTAEAYVKEFYQHEEDRTLHHYKGMFLAWREGRYVQIEDEAIRHHLQEWLAEAVRPVVDKATKEMSTEPFQSNPATVKQALDSIRDYVYLDDKIELGQWLEGEPPFPVEEVLACQTQLLHLPTGRSVGATPRYFSMNALTFDPDPEETMPESWLHFMMQLFGDDEESMHLLQEYMGYCLTADTRQQKMLMIVGPPRSGKGTIGRVLAELVGKSNVCAPTASSLVGQFGLQTLIGKSLAMVSDARFAGRDIKVLIERLLSITGEDPIDVDIKFQKPVTLKLSTRFVILTNEVPRLPDASDALARRLLVLQLSNSFVGHEDRRLTDKLKAELPGILNWAIEGYRRLHERGHFVEPAVSRDLVQEIEDLASPVRAFVRQRVRIDAGSRAYANALFDEFVRFCTAEGMSHHLSKSVFGRDLRAVVPGITRRRDNHGYFYEGIELKTELFGSAHEAA
ncbi:MAG: phage/plasmid primase, P4 family [Phycisphaeraceae bacterium]